MHADCVSYERMYSTGSGTYANVSTHTVHRDNIRETFICRFFQKLNYGTVSKIYKNIL